MTHGDVLGLQLGQLVGVAMAPDVGQVLMERACL